MLSQAPVVQATPTAYDVSKTYYAPVATVTPAGGTTVYALPAETAYQAANKYQPLYDATKKYYPVAPVAAPSVPTTVYTVTAEPMYQTCAH